MYNKILVVEGWMGGYSEAVVGLGHLTNDTRSFMEKPTEFVLVVFTGGEDVDPSLYNDTSPLSMCASNMSRDILEKVLFRRALNNNIPMIGICRGFQFLNVMAGGRLMHHIGGHGGTVHDVSGHIMKSAMSVNSFHHQMVIPGTNSRVVGWSQSKLSSSYFGKHDKLETYDGDEVEIAIFPKIRACGVQYHPEGMSPTSRGFTFFYNMANRLIKLPISKFTRLYAGEGKDGKQASTAVCACSNSTTGQKSVIKETTI